MLTIHTLHSSLTVGQHRVVDVFIIPTIATQLRRPQNIITGDPLHSRALAHSRAQLFTQPCPHCSHSRAPGEQWARLCVFTLQGCVQAARLCRGSPVIILILWILYLSLSTDAIDPLTPHAWRYQTIIGTTIDSSAKQLSQHNCNAKYHNRRPT